MVMVLYHFIVCWLSKRKVLNRFFNLHHEIRLFLGQHGANYHDLVFILESEDLERLLNCSSEKKIHIDWRLDLQGFFV